MKFALPLAWLSGDSGRSTADVGQSGLETSEAGCDDLDRVLLVASRVALRHPDGRAVWSPHDNDR